MSTVTKDYRNRKKVVDYYVLCGIQLELVQHRTKRGCRDLWGADLVGKDATGFVFIQVKAGRRGADGQVIKDLAGPVTEFAKHGPWPADTQLIVALCLKGKRVPYLCDVTDRVVTKCDQQEGE